MNTQLSYLKQYYSVFNKMQIISRTDTHGIITSVNQNFCDISGYSKAELIGFSHNKIKHPDMKDAIFTKMWKTISSGKIWQGEVKNYTKKKGFYWTRSIIFPIFDDDKNIVEYVSFREDITRKKLLELKQEKEDNLRREILHSQSNMVMLVHKTKGIIFMNNQCFLELAFTSRQEFIKKHECICELFIDRTDFLQKSTEDRHWLKDFEEFPKRNHKALILNKNNEEQIYHVEVNEFKENKNLIVINFLNITEFEDCKEELAEDQDKIAVSELKIKQALEKIDKESTQESASSKEELLEELKLLLS